MPAQPKKARLSDFVAMCCSVATATSLNYIFEMCTRRRLAKTKKPTEHFACQEDNGTSFYFRVRVYWVTELVMARK